MSLHCELEANGVTGPTQYWELASYLELYEYRACMLFHITCMPLSACPHHKAMNVSLSSYKLVWVELISPLKHSMSYLLEWMRRWSRTRDGIKVHICGSTTYLI